MTVLEVVAALWVMATVCIPCFMGWNACAKAQAQIDKQMFAERCLNQAGEAWLAAEMPMKTYRQGEKTCVVEVRRNDSTEAIHLVGKCGDVEVDTWLPVS